MFKIRTTAPKTWNKLYNNRNNGGLSWCINGNPTVPIANVLANCVGYACARFNEVYNEESGFDGIKYPELCCDAEVFWRVADNLGLKKGQIPKAGSIMVWEGLGDLAGHVAFVERVENNNQVYTSESGYLCTNYFWNAHRAKGNGNWGAGNAYRFLGFIYNPAVKGYKWEKKWHLYDEDGNMLTGWHKVDNKWYYLNNNGIMLTGWQFINKYWYLLKDNGEMLTGWQLVKDKWYYMDTSGKMQTGWLKDGGKWYLLSNNGDMLTGWQKVKDKWYYLTPKNDGTHLTGEMWTGWLKDKGKWYYLDLEKGYMYIGTHTINGKVYKFNNDGSLIE